MDYHKSKKDQEVLISIKAFTHEGVELIKSALSELSLFIEIEKLSPIYKIEGRIDEGRHIHDLRTEASFKGLCLVIRAKSKCSPETTVSRLEDIENKLRSEALYRNLSINLLVFGDLVCMSPQLTLPYPEFHLRPEEIVPAAEIWPEFIHPILEKPLSGLSERYLSDHWGEFYDQGKSLLDF